MEKIAKLELTKNEVAYLLFLVNTDQREAIMQENRWVLENTQKNPGIFRPQYKRLENFVMPELVQRKLLDLLKVAGG